MPDAKTLQKIPIFKELGHDECEYLASAMTTRDVAPMETLFWVGDKGDEMYIVESGQIEICIPDMSGQEI